MPPVSKAHSEASSRWNAKRDNIMIRPEKAEGEAIRTAAKDSGLSVQQFILDAVREKMKGAQHEGR